MIFASVMCFSLRKSGQEKRAMCTLGETRMEVIRMRIRVTCHQEMCATWHQGEGSLQIGPGRNLAVSGQVIKLTKENFNLGAYYL